MQPTTSRDFQRAAIQRLTAADALLDFKMNLDARYLGGYAMECSLKALILHITPDAEFEETLKAISSGSKMHRPEVLLNKLKELGAEAPSELGKRIRRFHWTTDLRYETGRRDTGETIGFLRTARMLCEWVEKQLP